MNRMFLAVLDLHPYSVVASTDLDPHSTKKAMSNQRSFKIKSFHFAAFVPKKIEYIRF
jgi:hypothetical protein